ncbi:hypothetical protein GCM10010342_17440 [Streptomyces anulatus]|nr:hypothetical protein GCM10010342_17440 [Streptomyces anulatus]
MHGDREVDGGQDHLLGELTVLDEPHPQRVGLADHPAQGALEKKRVHGAVDVQVFGDVVNGVRGIDPLRVPNTGLCRRQRESDFTGFWHDNSLPWNQKMVKAAPREYAGSAFSDRARELTPPHRLDATVHLGARERPY